MVAAAKLRRAQEAAENSRAYSEKLTALLQSLSTAPGAGSHPLLQPGAVAPPHAILVTADKGLCGGYNANLIRLTERFRASEDGRDATLTVCGRRGRDHFRRIPGAIASEHVNVAGGADIQLARTVAEEATRRFVEGTCGAVYIIYARFRSAISQQATVERLLPISPDNDVADGQENAALDYVYEPDATAILDRLLPRYVETRVYHGLLESAASEHGARMTAMDSATNNASDMIDRLTLDMNRARQAGITTELMEIVGGAEALKG